MQSFLDWDQRVSFFLNHLLPHNQFFDVLFRSLSGYGSSVLIWVVIVGLLMIFEEKRHREFLWSFVISVGTSIVLVNFVLKNIFQRIRPSFILAGMNFCPSDYAFPSGHATVAFAAATILSHFDSKRAVIYYVIAGLVAFSRIYLGCHYIVDVVAGAVLGYLVSFILLRYFSKEL